MNEDRNESVIEIIEQDLNIYDKIFLFDTEDRRVLECMSHFCDSRQLKETPKKILVMGIGAHETSATDCYRPVTKRQFEDLLDVYDMYEFSDKFQYISQKEQYGSMFNYINTGILTYGEMFEAMLH